MMDEDIESPSAWEDEEDGGAVMTKAATKRQNRFFLCGLLSVCLLGGAIFAVYTNYSSPAEIAVDPFDAQDGTVGDHAVNAKIQEAVNAAKAAGGDIKSGGGGNKKPWNVPGYNQGSGKSKNPVDAAALINLRKNRTSIKQNAIFARWNRTHPGQPFPQRYNFTGHGASPSDWSLSNLGNGGRGGGFGGRNPGGKKRPTKTPPANAPEEEEEEEDGHHGLDAHAEDPDADGEEEFPTDTKSETPPEKKPEEPPEAPEEKTETPPEAPLEKEPETPPETPPEAKPEVPDAPPEEKPEEVPEEKPETPPEEPKPDEKPETPPEAPTDDNKPEPPQEVTQEKEPEPDTPAETPPEEPKSDEKPETPPDTPPEEKPETPPDAPDKERETPPDAPPETPPEEPDAPEEKPDTPPETPQEKEPEAPSENPPDNKPETPPEAPPDDKPETPPAAPEDEPETPAETPQEKEPETPPETPPEPEAPPDDVPDVRQEAQPLPETVVEKEPPVEEKETIAEEVLENEEKKETADETTDETKALGTTQDVEAFHAGHVDMSSGAKFEVLEQLGHDHFAFTQGLTYANGVLYESTGLYGKSTVRILDPDTADVKQSVPMQSGYFGEGMTFYKDKLVQIIWKKAIGFVYDANDITKPPKQFTYKTIKNNEGWGITYDEDRDEFVITDGSPNLMFWDPECWKTGHCEEKADKPAVPVTRLDGSPAKELNEIEYWRGRVLANVWYSDVMLVIHPETGNVEKEYDFSSIFPRNTRNVDADVFNGISISEHPDVLYVTGKKWNRMFKIKLLV